MTQEEVKEKLTKLHAGVEAFSLEFSGKKNGKANGFYKPSIKTITIHNRNFEDNDTLLFYTAMHELAHHIQYTEHGQNGTRAHTQLFYSILDDLTDKAKELGIWKQEIDGETRALIDEATKISTEIAALQRQLGEVLFKLQETCKKKGIRFEEVVQREVKISDGTAKKMGKIAQARLPADIGFETQEAIAGQSNDEQRAAMVKAAADKCSVAQVKQAGIAKKPAKAEPNETETLLREKKQIEKSILSLKRRLNGIIIRLKKLKEGG